MRQLSKETHKRLVELAKQHECDNATMLEVCVNTVYDYYETKKFEAQRDLEDEYIKSSAPSI